MKLEFTHTPEDLAEAAKLPTPSRTPPGKRGLKFSPRFFGWILFL